MEFSLFKLLYKRKNLYLILCVIVVFIFTLSIVYATLSATLNITGSTEISSSSWDIYLDNVEVKSGSVEANVPEISGNDTLLFDVILTIPGEFYEFTVDVVIDELIDAMIDLSASDLPSEVTELSLGLTLVYIQSDGSGSDVKIMG